MSGGSDESSSGSRYETVRMLARGGMGSVEIAAVRKGGFRRLFALKRLRPELLSDERATAMLIEEGRIAGLLRHPNVVHVLDVGVDAQGPFLVMELVRGISAFDLFRRSKETRRPLDVQLVMRLLEQAASGLHAAHELVDDDGQPLGLVHRDVSPQNIMIGFDGVARVTDFGIAKALDVETHTTTGLLKGKAGYMAPEQLRFEPPDRRADLFSLGIVLFELLAARRLYREENVALSARRILHEPAPDLGAERSDAPGPLVELCFELLAKNAADRPATAKLVAQRLAELIAEDVVARGPFDVEAFLATEFAERLAETATWSRLAEEGAGVSAAFADASAPPKIGSGTDPEVATRKPPGRARSQRRWLLVGAISLFGVGAIGWLAQARLTRLPEPPSETTEAPARDAIETVGVPPEVIDDPAENAAAPDPEPVHEPSSLPEPVTAAAPDEPTADPRVRRRVRRRTETGERAETGGTGAAGGTGGGEVW